ncbi:hypothetical protein OROHE_010339 [Orobanche hederae]
MRKGSKCSACKSAPHHLFKDRAKDRVDDLQGMFSDLQSARKESRTVDVAVLEEQVHQMLREWKSELNKTSPASSSQQGLDMLKSPQEQGLLLLPGEYKSTGMRVSNMDMNNMNLGTQLDYHSFNFHQEFDPQYLSGFDVADFVVDDAMPQISGYQQNFCPPPSAFLGPKCALWDCPRPALSLDWSQKPDDYCSTYHAGLAPGEGYPGRLPVLRPGGIGLKDNLLFAALGAKAQGKDVGIPECEGAATAKSPWNAPEIFDLIILDGETIREWLFFDKPRRAFESGNRKQRSLPDYNGRGWHESRKQVMDEFGGLKRSYYMDPQPMENFEWHLFEYEINKYDMFALYRLEVKRVDGKKISKWKSSNDSVAALQKKLGGLSAEFPNDKQCLVKGRGKGSNHKKGGVYSGSNASASPREDFDYIRGVPYDYLVENINGYFLT